MVAWLPYFPRKQRSPCAGIRVCTAVLCDPVLLYSWVRVREPVLCDPVLFSNRTSQQMEKCYENSEPENRMGKSYIFLSGLVSDFGKAKFKKKNEAGLAITQFYP